MSIDLYFLYWSTTRVSEQFYYWWSTQLKVENWHRCHFEWKSIHFNLDWDFALIYLHVFVHMGIFDLNYIEYFFITQYANIQLSSLVHTTHALQSTVAIFKLWTGLKIKWCHCQWMMGSGSLQPRPRGEQNYNMHSSANNKLIINSAYMAEPLQGNLHIILLARQSLKLVVFPQVKLPTKHFL